MAPRAEKDHPSPPFLRLRGYTVHKAIKAAEAGAAKGMTVVAKTKTKVKVKPTSQGRSISGKR